MSYGYTKSRPVSLVGLAALLIFFELLPSAPVSQPLRKSSTSSEESPSEGSVASLESMSGSSSGMTRISGDPSIGTQQTNTEYRNWWQLINEADQKAYHATNPADKKANEEEAHRLRQRFEAAIDTYEVPKKI